MSDPGEYSINLNVLEHFRRLQEAEEGLSRQQGVDQQPSQPIQPRDSRGPEQSRNKRSFRNTKGGVNEFVPGNAQNAKTIVNSSIEPPPFPEPLKLPRKKKFYPCPCNSYKRFHPLHPMECGNLEYALTGKTNNLITTLPDEAHHASIRKRLEHPQFKKIKDNCLIVGWIKEGSRDSESSREHVHPARILHKPRYDLHDDLLGDYDVLLASPEYDLDNHSLPDDISHLTLGSPPLAPFEMGVSPPKLVSGMAESIETIKTDPSYFSLSSPKSIGNSARESIAHDKQKRESEFINSNRTDEDYCTDSDENFDYDDVRQAYLRSRPNPLPGIQEEEGEKSCDSEESNLKANTPSYHFDIKDYWDRNLQAHDSGISLPKSEEEDSDDGLELIDSRSALLAPVGTRWSSTNLSKDDEKLSASALIDRLTALQQKSKRGIRRRWMGILNRRRRNWSDNAKFYTSDCSSTGAAPHVGGVERKRIFGAVRKHPTGTNSEE
ncbi:hypothetical protein NHQ30_005433 [Ciborinia camelliae]|nr:hypothetical protein NHQ30_005433 [Ciborinia camelliae]